MSLLKKLFSRAQNEETAAPPPATSRPAPPPRIQEITPQDLKAQLENGRGSSLVVVDMRAGWEYQAGHIPGAIHMFIQEIPARFSELPQDADIVFQCWHGNTSLEASAFLIQQGWSEARVASLRGGMAGWVQAHGQAALARG